MVRSARRASLRDGPPSDDPCVVVYLMQIKPGSPCAAIWIVDRHLRDCHGGSRAVGGYGNGHCVDLWTAAGQVEALFAWIDRAGPAMGLARPMPNRDPAHVQPVGDWRAIAGRLRAARLKGPMIATVRVLGGADAIADLTELATGGRTNPSIGLASIMPANEGLPPRVHALPRPGVLVLAASKSPATVGLHKARRRPATASAAPRQRSSEQGRTGLSAGIRVSNRT